MASLLPLSSPPWAAAAVLTVRAGCQELPVLRDVTSSFQSCHTNSVPELTVSFAVISKSKAEPLWTFPLSYLSPCPSVETVPEGHPSSSPTDQPGCSTISPHQVSVLPIITKCCPSPPPHPACCPLATDDHSHCYHHAAKMRAFPFSQGFSQRRQPAAFPRSRSLAQVFSSAGVHHRPAGAHTESGGAGQMGQEAHQLHSQLIHHPPAPLTPRSNI